MDKARETRSLAEARVALLRERKSSLAKVAAQLGVDPSYVSHVNAGRKGGPASRRVLRAIARELGLPVREAFPELDERAA